MLTDTHVLQAAMTIYGLLMKHAAHAGQESMYCRSADLYAHASAIMNSVRADDERLIAQSVCRSLCYLKQNKLAID